MYATFCSHDVRHLIRARERAFPARERTPMDDTVASTFGHSRARRVQLRAPMTRRCVAVHRKPGSAERNVGLAETGAWVGGNARARSRNANASSMEVRARSTSTS